MLRANFAVYLGNEKEDSFSGFIVENNLLLALEVEEGLNKEDGIEALQKIKNEIVNSDIDNLFDFEQFLTINIKKINLPSTFSLAAGFMKDKILYLKTFGGGRIFLRRGRDFAQVIEGEKSASGYMEIADLYIFTTGKFVDLFGGELELRSIFDSKSPHQIVDELTPQLKSKEDFGAIGLFVQIEEKPSEQLVEEEKVTKIAGKNIFLSFRSYFQKLGKKKTLILLGVCVVAIILVSSIVFGLIKNSSSDSERKVNNVRQLVTLKLKQADDVAFLNLPRALALITEAKDEVNNLKKQIGANRQKEIADMENLINQEENKITNKQEKNYEEFYDLTLDNKSAKGDKFYLEGDSLDILDKSRGVIYSLSISKKSLNQKSSAESKLSDFIASYQGEIIFFVGGRGIYKISTDGIAKKVIDVDKDWGSIASLSMYNGNIYLLDRTKDQIYKYLVSDNGYSDKNLYFKSGSGISFKDVTSLSIDSSVYIGFPDHILKYTAATPDNFRTSFPQEGISMTKIFTSADVEKVYGWDEKKGAIYVLAKDGSYQGEINSPILSKASDFVVYNNSAFVLVKEKIYKIDLQ